MSKSARKNCFKFSLAFHSTSFSYVLRQDCLEYALGIHQRQSYSKDAIDHVSVFANIMRLFYFLRNNQIYSLFVVSTLQVEHFEFSARTRKNVIEVLKKYVCDSKKILHSD